MEINNVYLSRHRWREDTPENWKIANPVLASSEPGREIGTGLFKIGDGKTPWNSLEYVIPKDSIVDVPGDNKLYVRQRVNSDTSGVWVELPNCLEDAPIDGEKYVRQDGIWSKIDISKYASIFELDGTQYDLIDVFNLIPKSLTINDLYSAEYNKEIDMHTTFKDKDGRILNVYGKKINYVVTSKQNIADTNVAISNVENILHVEGFYETGLNNNIKNIPNGNVDVVLNTETKTVSIITKSEYDRLNNNVDIIIIFTKEN